MQTPEWLKPGLYGAACGAIALAIVGFSWGGWVTGGTARTMAADQSKADVVAALSLICVDQSKRDPQLRRARGGDQGCLVLEPGRPRDEERLGHNAGHHGRQQSGRPGLCRQAQRVG